MASGSTKRRTTGDGAAEAGDAAGAGPLTLEDLKRAMAGAAAFRSRSVLQPAGGAGTKVFPPTYAGAVYAVEQRRLPGREEPVTCVLLDSVQSQANRMEAALQDAVDGVLGENLSVRIPVIEVDFSDYGPDSDADETLRLIDSIGRVTSLQVPHRVADAILRDSVYRHNGEAQPFRKSQIGEAIDRANVRNATPLYELCPTALVFGMWDSTGPKGGLGAKFERAMTSEIVGVGCPYDFSPDAARPKNRGVRNDPLGVRAAVRVKKHSLTEWEVAEDPKAKGSPLRRSTTATCRLTATTRV